MLPGLVVPAVVVIVFVAVPAVVDLPVLLCPGVDYPVALGESGDDAGHGNGGDERDDGFVEEHCNECVIEEVVVFSLCLVGWY